MNAIRKTFQAASHFSHKRRRALFGVILLGVFVLQANDINVLPFLHRLENIAYDYRLKATVPGGEDKTVVIVDVDERSLAAEGQWPWRRDKLAHLVDQLFDHYGISLLGFDMVFAEREDHSALQTLESLAHGSLEEDQAFQHALEQLRSDLDHDRQFADSLKDRQVILGYVSNKSATTGQLPPPVMTLEGSALQLPIVTIHGYTANLPELQQAAYGGGFFDNRLVDEDGVYRRIPLVYRLGDKLYESLPLAMVRALYGHPPLELDIARTENLAYALEGLHFADLLRIPVDRKGAALVPYRGRQGSFPYVSATDVLHAKVDPKVMDGAIVLVGTTAAGLMDLRSTPVQNVYAGVEVHANLIAGMISQGLKARPNYTLGYELVAILCIGLLLNLLLPRLSPLSGVVMVICVLALALGVNLYFWVYHRIVFPIAAQLLLIITTFLFHSAYSHFIEDRDKRRLGYLFGQYVPHEIVEEMSDSEEDFGIGGESREMTVLFSDVRNFTAISEGLEPDELTHMMNVYLTRVTGIIHHGHGTIDKYIGDAVMAFWGAPLRDPEHPRHAVEVALEMCRQMREVRTEFQARNWPALHIGVGINTGLMNVGNMGSEFRMAYTVLGDAVNLGSRLEGLTKEYGVGIIASESTKAGAAGIVFRELGRVRVKGKEQAVSIYEPLAAEGTLSADQERSLHLYTESLEAYRARHWDQSEQGFRQLAVAEPEHRLYRLYLDQIAGLRRTPPGPDWDAVITFKNK